MNRTRYLLISLVVVVGILVSWGRIFPAKGPVTLITDPNDLSGIQTGLVPWSVEVANLRSRLDALGLPALAAEGSALHIHQHVDLNINDAAIVTPAGIGVGAMNSFISPIHTHDTSGVIHVESNIVRDFTLGQFFDIWGVRFTADCIGGYCADATHTLTVYSNGTPVTDDPRALVLTAHQEIMVVYSEASSTPAVISSYTFPAGE